VSPTTAILEDGDGVAVDDTDNEAGEVSNRMARKDQQDDGRNKRCSQETQVDTA
jgi:hypothetical protein